MGEKEQETRGGRRRERGMRREGRRGVGEGEKRRQQGEGE